MTNTVPIVPRDVLFGDPHRTSPEISPNGKLLGFIAPYPQNNGVPNVWVGPLDESEPPQPVTNDQARGISAYGFCQDDRTLVYLQDDQGDENWRIHLLDLASGESRCATPQGVRAQILRHNKWHPTTLLIGLNERDPRLTDVYRLDVAAGSIDLVEPNPGFASWIIDSDLHVRGGMQMTPDGGAVVLIRDSATGDFEPWKTIPADDLGSTDILGFTRDQQSLLLLTSMEANTTRLLSVDMTSGRERVVAEDPRYDIGAVIQDPETLEPQALIFAKERAEWLWLDHDIGVEVAELGRRLRVNEGIDGEINLGRAERTDRLWLVPVMPSDGSTRYYLYNRDTAQYTLLFSHRPELDDCRLATMDSFSFTARDGLAVNGYVSYPPGAERRNLPCVVLVHGGPRARDTWGFRPEAQWLANRGYVCLQVNFRGSTGFGKAFSRAGHKEWGRRMLHDLVDAVRHASDNGWIDKTRVGIMGASYGGYAALAGAAFEPGVFRCAIDLYGPSNLLTLLDSIPEYWKPMLSYLRATVGCPDTERDMLWERSPLSRVDDIDIPIMVVQGKNDPRVKQAESEQIVDALKQRDIAHEYLRFDDEGHGIARKENRETFYARAEQFLADHLGGRVERA